MQSDMAPQAAHALVSNVVCAAGDLHGMMECYSSNVVVSAPMVMKPGHGMGDMMKLCGKVQVGAHISAA
jgi:hypothetical protein